MRVLDTALPRLRACALVALVAVLAAGCASRTHKAPVEQRQPAAATQVPAPPAATQPPAAVVPVLPGAENAGRPGYYTVKPGDTMIRIGLEAGQNWRDIARWNGLSNANVIEVGQVLRVVPPAADGVAVQPVATAGPVESRPLAAAATASAASAAPSPAPAAAAVRIDPEEDLGWAWPAVKHNATFLTAYAHNQTLLVKEDEVVRRGQKIAEMGSTDAERVQLHFEIRRQGRPIDPARLLPPR